MRIPSYDDLTPSIPDVSALDVFASVARLMPAAPPVAVRQKATASVSVTTLFACVYMPEPSSRARDTLSAIAQAFSPRFQRYGDMAVVLDVSGLGRLLGDARAIGAELESSAREAGGRLHVAVAPTQTAAMVLAMARPALTIVTTDGPLALAPLALTWLQQAIEIESDPDGTDHPRVRAAFDVFHRWGLTTIGELAALPPIDLSERLGADGPALHARANGMDPRPLVPDVDAPRFMASMELDWPIESLEPLSFVFARILDPLCGSLERADRGAVAVRLDLRLVDRTTHPRALQLPAPIRDPRVLRTLLLLDLESNPPAAAIDTVTIEVDPAPARIVQYSLLERAAPTVETIATLTARLNALVGDTRCGTPVVLDTYRPDGFAMLPFAGSAGATTCGSCAPGAEAAPGRPDSSAVRSILRRFRPPIAVRVTVDGSRPAWVAIDRRGMPGGGVEQVSGPWRTSGGWWEHGGRWDRDEWDLALSDGSLCRIYRDRLSGVWFLEGVFD